ncbi:hypothetical protein NDU88_001627 [Pleurodeles waltl]|uniref:Uncharacterized protein n=1 Tax=Pleurodeles waltl TaxID=8319 RepID=A0AAV7T0R6_PLEWA|nr:hypothetical protein NDU88_001627 [Pleurodeles waltl]
MWLVSRGPKAMAVEQKSPCQFKLSALQFTSMAELSLQDFGSLESQSRVVGIKKSRNLKAIYYWVVIGGFRTS